MSFLNPVWLLALPVIFLPIVIHLWNQRRHKTIPWGAMQFLLSAKRMSRGMARLKHWLIMASRMVVIAGLIFMLLRPLSSGWLATLGSGRPETILILLDRSASMQQRNSISGDSKLRAGSEKIVSALETLGGQSRIYLVEPWQTESPAKTVADGSTDQAANGKPIRGMDGLQGVGQVVAINKPGDLLDLPEAAATDASVDMPAMLQAALDFVTENQTGRTDIWICSDNAENDWAADSSRWQALKSGFAQLEGVRFHLLNYDQPVDDNLSVRVDRWERETSGEQPELVLDITVRRTGVAGDAVSSEVPLTIDVGGVRSIVKVVLENDSTTLRGHRIALDKETVTGWGSVEIPADENPSDNRFFFTFAQPMPMQTVVISDQGEATYALELAASVPSQMGATANVVRLGMDQVQELDWANTTLLIWAQQLPTGNLARQVNRFIESGRSVIFLPPAEPDDAVFAGLKWTSWKKATGAGARVGYWNNDDGLLMQTGAGQSLPLEEILVYQNCGIEGGLDLARLETGDGLLVRAKGSVGHVYALTTWTLGTHSNLDREGISLYVMLQRALSEGAAAQGVAKVIEAGSKPAMVVSQLKQRNGRTTVSEATALPLLAKWRPFRAGVYGDESGWVALNRPELEDSQTRLDKETQAQLFSGLDFHVINDQLDSGESLASEIWKFFVIAMVSALLLEAFLCLPEKSQVSAAASVVRKPEARAAA